MNVSAARRGEIDGRSMSVRILAVGLIEKHDHQGETEPRIVQRCGPY